MASKLINLIALTSLAVLTVSFGPAETNALSTGHIHANRHVEVAQAVKRKRDTKRCKVRPSTIATSSHTPTASPTASVKALVETSTKEPEPTTTKAPAKTTSSPKPATTTKASSGNSGGSSGGSPAKGTNQFGVRGSKICFASGEWDLNVIKKFKTDHTVGLYNWTPSPPGDLSPLGLDFWPMLWGNSQDKIDAFEKAMSKNNAGTIILGPNECNEEGQSNITPQQAADLWKAHIEPKCRNGYKCATPAMSSRPNGFQWMKDFMAACNDCTFNYQAVHWYDTSFEKLRDYLTKYHNQLGLPIMLTEFADQNFNGGAQASKDEIFSFMGQALKWIDDTDWMVAACPFGLLEDLQGVNTLNALLKNGNPTDLGYMVINNSY